MQRILLSALVVGGVVGAAVYGTTAFFSDTETSVNNTFTAGALDLTIDSTAHYNGMVCANVGTPQAPIYQWQDEDPNAPNVMPEMLGTECFGTWNATNLNEMPFFSYSDIKPGDEGENTISMHVSNNDAWLRMRLVGKANAENTVVDPELELLDTDTPNMEWCGELAQNMQYSLWVDQGAVVGWQNSDDIVENNDALEGDNLFNGIETYSEQNQPVLDPGLAAAICANVPAEVATNWSSNMQIPAGETQYIGVSWGVPDAIGNIIQTDSIMFDVEFQVEQVRNNDTPFI